MQFAQPNVFASGWEVLVGRMLAAFVHPLRAWRFGLTFRVLLISAYFLAGYFAGLAILAFLNWHERPLSLLR